MGRLILILFCLLAVTSYSACGYADIKGPVAQYLIPTKSRLYGLVIKGSGNRDDDHLESGLVREIAGLLETNQLTKIELVNVFFQGDSLQIILNALRVNTTLTELDLEVDGIGAKDANAIAGALLVNTTLTKLNLYGNNIGAKGASTIADALRVNTTLASLNIRGNNIGAEGVHAIANALRVNTTLIDFDLGINNLGAEDVRAIADALQRNGLLIKLIIHLRKYVLEAVTDEWSDCPPEIITSVIEPYGISYDGSFLLSKIMDRTLKKEKYLDAEDKKLIAKIKALQKDFIAILIKSDANFATLAPTDSSLSSSSSSSSSSQLQAGSVQSSSSSSSSSSSMTTHTHESGSSNSDKPSQAAEANSNSGLDEHRYGSYIYNGPRNIKETFSDIIDDSLNIEQQLSAIESAVKLEGYLNNDNEKKLEALEKEIKNLKLPSIKKEELMNRVRAIKYSHPETAHYYLFNSKNLFENDHTTFNFEETNIKLDPKQLDDVLGKQIIKDPYCIPTSAPSF